MKCFTANHLAQKRYIVEHKYKYYDIGKDGS